MENDDITITIPKWVAEQALEALTAIFNLSIGLKDNAEKRYSPRGLSKDEQQRHSQHIADASIILDKAIREAKK